MLGDGEEEEKKEFDPNDHRIDVEHVRQDDFFYKIKEHNKEKKHYIIEIPQIKKKYRVQFKQDEELGFVGLPQEWERYIRELKVEPYEMAKSPLAFLMTVNYVATQGFKSMLNKANLYERMSKICDQIKRKNPYESFR